MSWRMGTGRIYISNGGKGDRHAIKQNLKTHVETDCHHEAQVATSKWGENDSLCKKNLCFVSLEAAWFVVKCLGISPFPSLINTPHFPTPRKKKCTHKRKTKQI